ncbi:hypothetical protein KDA23_00670 [Candidatus Saccharibacteria bacterium]|nr:hypothetical protein [Candidatus Saccharibacteria bacterium]
MTSEIQPSEFPSVPATHQSELDVTTPREPEALVVDAAIPEASDDAKSRALKKWLTGGALGLAVVGGAYALATNPIGELAHDVKEAAPWAVGGLALSEAAFVVGGGMALTGAGKNSGGLLRVRTNYMQLLKEAKDATLDSRLFRTGVALNTVGALGTAATIGVGAVVALPPETWPGAVGVAGLDMAGTFAVRSPIYAGIRRRQEVARSERAPRITVRHARLDDIDRLADIDLASFDEAYGDDKPEKTAVVDMLTRRWHNAADWMYVAEQQDEIRGFVTAFRTNKSADEFTSWEDTTNDGTLDGVVEPKGKYVYVCNMTIEKGFGASAMDMLLANLFANSIAEGGVEYGYFESRMPQFRRLLERNGLLDMANDDPAFLSELAQDYTELRRRDGKRYDWQLRMYEGMGFTLGRAVSGAFNDEGSMNFGVVAKVASPLKNQPAIVRRPAAKALRQIAKHPKLLEKALSL